MHLAVIAKASRASHRGVNGLKDWLSSPCGEEPGEVDAVLPWLVSGSRDLEAVGSSRPGSRELVANWFTLSFA